MAKYISETKTRVGNKVWMQLGLEQPWALAFEITVYELEKKRLGRAPTTVNKIRSALFQEMVKANPQVQARLAKAERILLEREAKQHGSTK